MRRAQPSPGSGLSQETAGWRGRPNQVSALETSATTRPRQSTLREYSMIMVPTRYLSPPGPASPLPAQPRLAAGFGSQGTAHGFQSRAGHRE